jgi:bifunctional oligoribonuclease and PAP phosphatase NrnA
MPRTVEDLGPTPPRALVEALSRRGGEVLLLGHVHPDADVLGTLLAIGIALEPTGWSVTLAGPHPVPAPLRFLPGAERYRAWQTAPRAFPVIVMTDCPNPDRAEGLLEDARGVGGQVFNIDHHPDNRRYGTVNWIDPGAAATGEMVFDLLRALGLKITADIAVNLFTAIHTDTGSFRYSNTTPRTLRIAAELLECGVRPDVVTDRLYQQRPPDALPQLGEILRRVQVSGDGAVAWLGIEQGLVSDAFAAAEDLVNYPRSIAGVRVAVLLREEEPGVVKVSLRGKGDVPVNRIARRFGGGGHDNAAGCTVAGTLPETTERVLAAVREALSGEPP